MCLPDVFFLITKLQDVVYAIYLLIFLRALKFIHFICKSFVSSFYVSFFSLQFSNNLTLVFCFSLFWQFTFLFLSLRRRSRRWRWLTNFYHFTSFHNLLFYQHFTKNMYIFLLIFVDSIGNTKSDLTFHTIIINPTKIFWKERSVNVLMNLHISIEVFLSLGNVRCFQQ